MDNNMIALQARAPQTNFLGNAVQRNAQMINMMRQQEAADRQAATAAKNADIAASQEARAVSAENRAAAQADRDAAKSKLDLAGLVYTKYREMAPIVAQGGPAVYADWLAQYAQEAPAVAATIAKAMPPESFDTDKFILMMGKMDQRFEARYGKAITKEIVGPGGEMYGANISSIPNASSAAPIPDISKPVRGARPPAPAAAPNGQLRATRGVNTTPRDLEAQLDAAAQAVARGAGVNDPALRNLGENDFLEVQKRASRIMQGSPEFQQMSMKTGGAPAQADLGGIVQQMMQTGVVSQSDVQTLRAAAGPQKEAQLAQLMRANNIQIMPDEGGAGGMQNAVYRPGEGDAAMQQTQYNPNDYQQVRVKSPMVSPSAPSKTPEQIYREELAKERAKADAARSAGPKPLTPAQEAKLRDNIAKDYKAAQSTLDMMLNPVSGVVAAVDAVRKLGADQKEAITGYSGYLPTVLGSTKTADTKIKNLRGKVTEMGKNVASLAGAIGQMAVQEWKIVSDMIANLDLEGMGAKDLDDQLDIIEAQARRAAEVTRDAYENQYVEEFARYPNRFQLKAPAAGAARTPIKGGVDKNNPLLRGR